jgi:hypothetical protein
MNLISGFSNQLAAIQFGARPHPKPKIIIPMPSIKEESETGDDDSIAENESPLPFSMLDRQEGDTIWVNRHQESTGNIVGGRSSSEPAQRRSVDDSAQEIISSPPALYRQRQGITTLYNSSEISSINSYRSLDHSRERVALPWKINQMRRLRAGTNAFRNLSPTHSQSNAPQSTRPQKPAPQPEPNQKKQPD